MTTYSQPAWEYPTTHRLVRATSSLGPTVVTKVHATVHITLPMRHSLSPSTALLLAVSASLLTQDWHHRSGGNLLLKASNLAVTSDACLSKGRMVVHPVVASFTLKCMCNAHNKASQSFCALVLPLQGWNY